jgi:hypothetical protein
MRLTVEPDDLVKKLKKAVFKKAKIAIDVQCIMFNGKELSDMQSIEDAGIEHLDEVRIETYSINVAHWLGDTFVLTDVLPSDTVEDLKNLLLQRKQIPKEMQKFTFKGKSINEFIGLKDQGIGHKSTLVMLDLEIIKSPRPKRATVAEIKYVDTSDEESVSDGDGDDDGSQASWLERCALDEDYVKDLVKIDTTGESWLAKIAAEEEKKEEFIPMAPDLET